MKKILLLSVFTVFTLSIALAQPPQGRQRLTVEERAKRTTDWMKTELALTQEQVAPIDSINLLYTKAQQVLFQSSEGDRSKIRESMSALENEKQTALSKVLTPKQLEDYKKRIEEMRNNRGERNRDGGQRNNGNNN